MSDPRPDLAGANHVSRVIRDEEVELNPQPLPPIDDDQRLTRHGHDEVELNPQPLPPIDDDQRLTRHGHDEVELNPQPEPPG
jgi:hypothetical protein